MPPSAASNIDPTPAFAFGHGIAYGTFSWSDPSASATALRVDGSISVSLTVRNDGDRDGIEVVQLYLRDPVASVVRPTQRLVGYARIPARPGEETQVSFDVPADLAAFSGSDGRRIVEPGVIVLGFGRSSADIVAECSVMIEGDVRVLDHQRALHAGVNVQQHS